MNWQPIDCLGLRGWVDYVLDFMSNIWKTIYGAHNPFAGPRGDLRVVPVQTSQALTGDYTISTVSTVDYMILCPVLKNRVELLHLSRA